MAHELIHEAFLDGLRVNLFFDTDAPSNFVKKSLSLVSDLKLKEYYLVGKLNITLGDTPRRSCTLNTFVKLTLKDENGLSKEHLMKNEIEDIFAITLSFLSSHPQDIMKMLQNYGEYKQSFTMNTSSRELLSKLGATKLIRLS